MWRRDGEVGRLAFSITGLVELERNSVRTHPLCFIRLRVPACIEAVAKRLVGIAIENFQAIPAILYRYNDLPAASGRYRNGRRFDQFFGFCKARMPAALIIESPVVVAVLTEQAHRHRSGGFEVPIAVRPQNFKFDSAAFTRIIALK